MFSSQFLSTLRQKFWIPILTIAIFALAIGGEKYLSGSDAPMYQAGDAYAQRLATIEFNSQSQSTELDFFTNSELMMYRFIERESEKIEWNRYNRNWDGMDVTNKLKWFYKRITVERFDPNFYLFKIAVLAEDSSDLPYVNSTIKNLADDYVEFASERIEQSGIGKLVVIDSVEVLSEPTPVTKKKIMLKYFVIGGVLGAIVGAILIGAIASRTRDV